MKFDICISLFIVYLISQLKGEWAVDGAARMILLTSLFGCILVVLKEYRKIRKGDENVD